MQVVRAMRLRVNEGDSGRFEGLAAAQVQRMHEAASGVVFYVVVRRTESGSFFSDPRPGTVEYLFLAAAKDAEGAAQLEANEPASFWSDLDATLASPAEVELIEPSFTCGVSRDMVWTPQSMWRLSLYRMRVKPNDGEMEDGIRKMIARVRDLEPDPRIYTLVKRDTGKASTLLPAAPSDRDEYIRFHAYQVEDGLTHHYSYDKKWWANFYQSRLDGPLEAQQIFSDDIVAGFTRDQIWGSPTEYNAAELES
jgi:hypothetical protein